MGKKRDPYGVTRAYLAWKKAGSPGSVWCRHCDTTADANHECVEIPDSRVTDPVGEWAWTHRYGPAAVPKTNKTQ